MTIDYSVKIHYPECNCKFYKKVTKNNTDFLVAPYKTEDFIKKYYLYNNENILKNDIIKFKDNCVCTRNKKHVFFNGGIIILSKYKNNNIPISDSNEMINYEFKKILDIKNIYDNSNLINNFYKFINNSINKNEDYLLDWYVLIGQVKNNINYSFPKGKIKYNESLDECCLREFYEETNYKIPYDIYNANYQLVKREEYKLNIPLEIKVDNFILKIIII
jgi:hypothetical protein